MSLRPNLYLVDYVSKYDTGGLPKRFSLAANLRVVHTHTQKKYVTK